MDSDDFFSSPARTSKFSTSTPGSVAFISVDDVVFYVDSEQLQRATDFMPTPGLGAITFAPTEPARLDEGADVLELLFRFACFDEYVNLDQASFKVVAELAEAAQKYIVHTAIAACRVYMKGNAQDHPLEVMTYAYRHDYLDILDKAAPCTIGLRPCRVKKTIPSALIAPWEQYYSMYEMLTDSVVGIGSKVTHGETDCSPPTPCKLGGHPSSTRDYVQRELLFTIHKTHKAALFHPEQLFTAEMFDRVEGCELCEDELVMWREEALFWIQQAHGVPLTSFLCGPPKGLLFGLVAACHLL
ncbi:hypothetical protein K525DRAFT_279838 [Schizophyllum commune Loenen D]|nr:hypothetical protein K525DRAFT_279838 [Schizophyllum commune Loenen D]